MGFVDIIFMIAIVCGAVYLLYRSIWKKKVTVPGAIRGCVAGRRKIIRKNVNTETVSPVFISNYEKHV